MDTNRIRFDRPAGTWQQAFPLGNGHIGAMVYGGVGTERIDLSENTFYSGSAVRDESTLPDADEIVYGMRQLLRKGNYAAAGQEAARLRAETSGAGTNLPVGILRIDYDTAGEAQGYERCLDIRDGIATCRFVMNDVEHLRRIFVSHPHKVLCFESHADAEEHLHVSLESVSGEIPISRSLQIVGSGEACLHFAVEAREKRHTDGRAGAVLLGQLRVETDGQIIMDRESLEVQGARHTILYLQMMTDLETEGLSGELCLRRLNGHMLACLRCGIDALRVAHTTDIRGRMDRVQLAIEGGEGSEQVPFYFQYGRYLLLCSSREDSVLPAHLQGIWNDFTACRSFRGCGLRTDIHLQMNYYPAQAAALEETTAPLFSWTKQKLFPQGRKNAALLYRLRGWEAELLSSPWGYAGSADGEKAFPCPVGGALILTQLWEQYLYTGDRDLLQEEIYPLLEEAVQFYSGYLFADEDHGYLIGGPSVSPESMFVADGQACCVSNGCTFEILVIRELFHMYLTARKHLQKQEDLFSGKICSQMHRLLPYRITSDGKLAEWDHDYPPADIQQGSTSHLSGVYPFAQITPESTPDLAKAAQAVIDEKLNPEPYWEDTCCSRGQVMLYEARLHDGDSAFHHMNVMLAYLTQENGMMVCPPVRGCRLPASEFELDGNTAFTACTTELLMQSHNGVIQLLPALPSAWKKGSVSGLRARGGVRVDLEWEEGELIQALLFSEKTTTCRVRYGDYEQEIHLQAKKTFLIE